MWHPDFASPPLSFQELTVGLHQRHPVPVDCAEVELQSANVQVEPKLGLQPELKQHVVGSDRSLGSPTQHHRANRERARANNR
jgi:hypothetical protein